jgi:hypothetical protein
MTNWPATVHPRILSEIESRLSAAISVGRSMECSMDEQLGRGLDYVSGQMCVILWCSMCV